MPFLTLSEKIRISFEDKTVHIRSLSLIEELLEAFKTAGDSRIMSTKPEGPRAFGNVYPLNHTFSSHQQKQGAPAMYRIVLDTSWGLSGFNKLVDARCTINHAYDSEGKKREHYVIELDKQGHNR